MPPANRRRSQGSNSKRISIKNILKSKSTDGQEFMQNILHAFKASSPAMHLGIVKEICSSTKLSTQRILEILMVRNILHSHKKQHIKIIQESFQSNFVDRETVGPWLIEWLNSKFICQAQAALRDRSSAVEVLIELLHNCVPNKRLIWSGGFVPRMVACLNDCGDYEMQSLLVELLMRVSNREKHGKQMKSAFRDAKWDSSVPPVDTILEMFFKISADQFTEDCRSFLNAINGSQTASLTMKHWPVSLKASSVQLTGEKGIEKTGNFTWIDFNKESLTALCGNGGETALIELRYFSDIGSWHLDSEKDECFLRLSLYKPPAGWYQSTITTNTSSLNLIMKFDVKQVENLRKIMLHHKVPRFKTSVSVESIICPSSQHSEPPAPVNISDEVAINEGNNSIDKDHESPDIEPPQPPPSHHFSPIKSRKRQSDALYELLSVDEVAKPSPLLNETTKKAISFKRPKKASMTRIKKITTTNGAVVGGNQKQKAAAIPPEDNSSDKMNSPAELDGKQLFQSISPIAQSPSSPESLTGGVNGGVVDAGPIKTSTQLVPDWNINVCDVLPSPKVISPSPDSSDAFKAPIKIAKSPFSSFKTPSLVRGLNGKLIPHSSESSASRRQVKFAIDMNSAAKNVSKSLYETPLPLAAKPQTKNNYSNQQLASNPFAGLPTPVSSAAKPPLRNQKVLVVDAGGSQLVAAFADLGRLIQQDLDDKSKEANSECEKFLSALQSKLTDALETLVNSQNEQLQKYRIHCSATIKSIESNLAQQMSKMASVSI